jgi:hypothetical protein
MQRLILFVLTIILISMPAIQPARAQTDSSADPAPPAVTPPIKVSAANTSSHSATTLSAKPRRGLSRRQKVIASLVVSALIGAAVSIPVAVATHQAREVHIRRARWGSEQIIGQEEALVQKRIATTSQLLAQGPQLLTAQQAALQRSTLLQEQQRLALLRQAYNMVAFGKGARAIVNGNAIAFRAFPEDISRSGRYDFIFKDPFPHP